MTEGDRAFERRVQELARSMHYPQTPDIAGQLADSKRQIGWRGPVQRPLVWAGAMALLLVVILLTAVPSARAAVSEAIRLGVVSIRMGVQAIRPEGGAHAPGDPTTADEGIRQAEGGVDFAGETTLPAAKAALPFPVRLPTGPVELGDPDRVFLQGEPPAGVILLWSDEGDAPAIALFELSEGMAVSKLDPESVATATVNGQPALWTTGPYLVEVLGGQLQARRLIDGHVLIWTEADVTYRLETSLELTEAVRIAESLE